MYSNLAAATIVALVALSALAAPKYPRAPSAGVAIPISKRSQLRHCDEGVRVEALKSHVAAAKAKILRGFDNFERNTGVPHPSDLKRDRRRSTGFEALTSDNNKLWYGTISVGTPAKIFTVDADTGSSDLILPGPLCTSNCTGHGIYDLGLSSTSQDLGRTFSLAYGDGSTVSGDLFSDVVSVSGLAVNGQTLGIATAYSSSLSPDRFLPDGLMGMAFQSISSYNGIPVFENIISQWQLDEPVFSFKLASSGSELYLGGANPALYVGDFTYTPVTQEGYWQVNVDGVQANGETVLSNVDAIIDTGTTLIIGNRSQVATLHDALGGSSASDMVGNGYYTFPCDAFPSVSFTFGGTSFPISAETLNVGPSAADSNACISGIVGHDTGSAFWVVGDVFLQNVYTAFDVGNRRVGFAQHA